MTHRGKGKCPACGQTLALTTFDNGDVITWCDHEDCTDPWCADGHPSQTELEAYLKLRFAYDRRNTNQNPIATTQPATGLASPRPS